MYNDSELISASEINKYTFCPYQWYYSRLYGQKTLAKLNREYLDSIGIEYKDGNFKKGLDAHRNFKFKDSTVIILKFIFLILMIACTVYIYIK